MAFTSDGVGTTGWICGGAGGLVMGDHEGTLLPSASTLNALAVKGAAALRDGVLVHHLSLALKGAGSESEKGSAPVAQTPAAGSEGNTDASGGESESTAAGKADGKFIEPVSSAPSALSTLLEMAALPHFKESMGATQKAPALLPPMPPTEPARNQAALLPSILPTEPARNPATPCAVKPNVRGACSHT
jgi:hypothetical protein